MRSETALHGLFFLRNGEIFAVCALISEFQTNIRYKILSAVSDLVSLAPTLSSLSWKGGRQYREENN